MRVTYQLQTTVGGVPWSWETHVESEVEAAERGKELAKDFAGVRWFMGLNVFDMDMDPKSASSRGVSQLICAIRLDAPTASIAMRRVVEGSAR